MHAEKNAVGRAILCPTIGHKLVAMFAPNKNLLVIGGALEPTSEASHEQLAALLDKDNPPEINVEFANVNDVLSVQVSFEHKTRNIAEHGAAELKLRHQARDRGIPVAQHKAQMQAAINANAATVEAKDKARSKEIVAELEDLYPDGAYTAFAGLTYCVTGGLSSGIWPYEI